MRNRFIPIYTEKFLLSLQLILVKVKQKYIIAKHVLQSFEIKLGIYEDEKRVGSERNRTLSLKGKKKVKERKKKH